MFRGDIGQFFVRFKGTIMGVVLLTLCASGIVFFLDSRSKEKRIKDGDAIYDVLRRNDESVEQKLAEVSEKFYEDYKNRTFSEGVCSILMLLKHNNLREVYHATGAPA
ncbi:hypothetical protein O997_04175 [Anaplasma phagocytophilum str. MRK]|uniref:hypothetical protein n=1 Tax=Anaplasma phagocytophilum TaxID=948 RepID=UPI000533BE2E|nr:hypothetical protein [Anaplasma phagocytophilum]KDB56311.1 hypothetical protein O997_04175 [Anaplasma phagocytophilum str. MRK]